MARDLEPWRDEVPMNYPREIIFRVGLSRVYATADLFSRVFPLVLRLSIKPRPWYGFMKAVVSWMPRFLQRPFKRWFPGSFLPTQVVLKQLPTEEERYTRLFDNEIRAYEKLQHLQGDVIPVFYGKATCENRRAMVVSLVEGTTGFQQTNPMPLGEFTRRLKIAHAKFQEAGMAYGDKKLDNVILTDDGRLVFIDLEWLCDYGDNLDIICDNGIKDFEEKYRDYLSDLEDQKMDRWDS